MILLFIAFLFAAGITYVFVSNKPSGVATPVVTDNVTKKFPTVSPTVKLKKFVHSSGFSFQHEEHLKVQEKKVNDDSSYASLMITSADRKGSMTIDAFSTSLKVIDDWFKTSATAFGQKDITFLKLADLDARQFTEFGKFMTIALDKGVLFTLSANYEDEKSYWSKIMKDTVFTFAFENPESPSDQGSSAPNPEEDVVFEGEEIVE